MYIYIKLYIALLIGSCATIIRHHPTWLKARDGLGCLESSRTSRRMARHTTGNVDEGAWLGVGIKKLKKKKKTSGQLQCHCYSTYISLQ